MTFDAFMKPFEPLYQKARAWWLLRAPREQLVLKLLGVIIIVCLFYWLIWQPTLQSRDYARSRYQAAHQTHDWIQMNAGAIHSLRQGQTSATASGDWVMNINQSAANAGLSLKGFTPEGNSRVRVVLESQPFANVMQWLISLDQKGIKPANLTIDSTDTEGRVNVHVTLASN